LTPNTSSNDESDDDDDDLLCDMGILYASFRGNKEAHASLEHSMETMNKYK
jgi:hypothetical protein